MVLAFGENSDRLEAQRDGILFQDILTMRNAAWSCSGQDNSMFTSNSGNGRGRESEKGKENMF